MLQIIYELIHHGKGEFERRQMVEDLQGQRVLEQTDRADVHCVRPRIKNVGDPGAEEVEVSVLEVRRCGGADALFVPWQ